jgi:hypothetical protein
MICKTQLLSRTIEEHCALSDQLLGQNIHRKAADFWDQDLQAVIFGKLVNLSESQFSPL